MLNAVAVFGAATTNGNGNGMVDLSVAASGTGEVLIAWQHLSLAGMIPDSMTGVLSSGGDFVAGTNVPRSAMVVSGGWTFYQRESINNWTVYGRKGATLELGDCAPYYGSAENICSGPLMTTRQAKLLDDKIDDGKADSGKVYGSAGYANGAFVTGCGAPWNAAGGSYDLSTTIINCRLFFWQ